MPELARARCRRQQPVDSYEYTSQRGAQKFVYEMLLRRPTAMVKGMLRILERIKQSVESQSVRTAWESRRVPERAERDAVVGIPYCRV